MLSRRHLVQIAPVVATLGAMGYAKPQEAVARYPTRPVRLIVPYPPGTASDHIARLVAQKLGERLGQPVVVDNRPGANGTVGTTEGALSTPDGHTLTLGVHATMVMNPHLNPRLPYRASSFAPVAGLIRTGFLLVASPDFPANSLGELISEAKRRPSGDINYGTYGLGSVGHLAGVMLNAAAGITLSSVHYSTPPIVDVAGGSISLSFEPFVQAAPYIRARRVKAIAVTTAQRNAAFPDLPTIGETLPGFEVATWLALFAPRGVPTHTVKLLSSEIVAILRLPDVIANIASTGAEPLALHADELKSLVDKDSAEVARLADAAKMISN